jgi:ElaB/YqjD/DUF883 family membrane-anchored ribosome-binding protein
MTVEAEISNTANTAEKSLKDAEKSLRGLVERLERGLQDVLEIARERSKVYAEGAGEQLETAQKYVTERVQERPLTATAAALGVGLLIGVLLAASSRR